MISTQTGTGANSVVREPNGAPVALRVGGVSYYYVTDVQGSTIALVDSAGVVKNRYSYDPYGNSRSKTETVVNPYQYIGGYLDASTGLYKLGIRYYDTTTGRFTQTDPTGQEANGYVYASGNPINLSDSSGAVALSDVADAISFDLDIVGIFLPQYKVVATVGSVAFGLFSVATDDEGNKLYRAVLSVVLDLVGGLGADQIGKVLGKYGKVVDIAEVVANRAVSELAD